MLQPVEPEVIDLDVRVASITGYSIKAIRTMCESLDGPQIAEYKKLAVSDPNAAYRLLSTVASAATKKRSFPRRREPRAREPRFPPARE